MTVLRKIIGVTRRDHRRNSDILDELSIEKDIVDATQTRRLSHFGHVACMSNTYFFTVTLMNIVLEQGQEKMDRQNSRRLQSYGP